MHRRPSVDIGIINDDLRNIAVAIRLSQKTHAVLWQNISIALGIKVVFLATAIFGNASMWMAVFADMGPACWWSETAFACSDNSRRALKGF